jgi:2-polyprenyl-3-methyl-5-hydroxy-6-metoxy-1,4-benzoquinol methylase
MFSAKELLTNKFRDAFLKIFLESNLKGSKKILDVACGPYSPIRLISGQFKSEGIDIFEPSLDLSKKRKIHNTYKKGNIMNLEKYYKIRSFDSVICIDVIEHFKKTDAIKLIKKMEKIARLNVILMTPNGFYHQDHLHGNPYEEHKSGWSVVDLNNLGYKVFGLRGLKFLRGEHASIIKKPWFFWAVVAFLSEPLLYFFPKHSYQLIAVKYLYEKN